LHAFKATTAIAILRRTFGDSMFKISLILLIGGLGLINLAGCSKKTAPLELLNSKLNSDTKAPDKVLSDRPQNLETVVALLKLKSPALFENIKYKDGKEVIDEELKKEIIKEQEETVKKLKELSSDIKVIYSYKFVLNGLTIATPVKFYKQVGEFGTIDQIDRETAFHQLQTETVSDSEQKDFKETSAGFIGALRAAKELGIDGEGIRVGIIDSGIDYTHSMFMGTGDPEVYKQIDPDEETEHFPNEKVVGGYDFVGSNYSPGAAVAEQRIPRPDKNPIDLGGHGTHVAATVAGIGDGVNTYDGVAPKAKLFALKVFGGGSTSDSVVIAAMEFAADPNGDLDPSDRLDVINLSLGGDYGKPYIMYSEAVKNLTNGGIVMVAAAGNAGPNAYIVGSPSTADQAISVGASIDGMEKNWKFKTLEFLLSDGIKSYVEIVEGNISKPVAEANDTYGKLVSIGEAATDLNDEQKASLKGNVALIDRGTVNFIDKLKRAFDAGATGAIVANNKPGSSFAMGGEGKVEIPAIMVTQAFGDRLKESMKTGDVFANFGSEVKIEKPELVDTITDFSSQGPRSLDSKIKPEITAPGFQIISAAMAGGNKGVAMNGTSMASPHMAGVMALMKQRYQKLSVLELKNLALNTAKITKDSKGNVYPITQQGSGRVQIFEALTSPLLTIPANFSLGETSLVSAKRFDRKLMIKNISTDEKTFTLSVKEQKGLKIKFPETVTLKAGEEKNLELQFTLSIDSTSTATKDSLINFEGRVFISEGEKILVNLPVLAVAKIISNIKVDQFQIYAQDLEEIEGASASLALHNAGKHQGEVLLFNLLAKDKRKDSDPQTNSFKLRSCDLQSVGYKIIEKENKSFLQMAAKIHSPMSQWQGCEIVALIDADGDGVAEQELAGISSENLRGLSRAVEPGYYSILLDAPKVRELRKEYEKAMNSLKEGDKKPEENYTTAIQDIQGMKAYHNSTIAVIEADITALKTAQDGRLWVKMATIGEGGVESDDYLEEINKWHQVETTPLQQAYVNLPENILLKAGEKQTLKFEKGEGTSSLLLLYPQNKSWGALSTRSDRQQSLPKPELAL
jgi:minor extracellular serine protease Vpr